MVSEAEQVRGYNLIVVFNENRDKLLMCRRKKEPYKGLSNFVGGKIEQDEDGLKAAYRELEEETSITKDDITLSHFMDFTYYMEDCYVEVYVGKLNKQVPVRGDENELYWSALDENFFDPALYAGEGNIGHILKKIQSVNYGGSKTGQSKGMETEGLIKDVEWIFFDVGSTLVDETRAYQHRIEDAIAGTDITYQQFYDTMLGYYRRNLKGDKEAIKQYGLIETKWHSEDESLYSETIACLEKLKLKYKIGVIANQPPGTKDRLQALGILRYIDLVVASAEEGAAKPDLKIFEIALERAKCMPQNAVMVGDRLDNDIAPAKTLGMHTVWIKQGFGKYSVPESNLEKADHIVNNLDEVCKLFTR